MGKIPKKIIISIDIHAGTLREIRRRRTAIFAPIALDRHAVVPAIGICLRKDHNIQAIDNGPDLCSAKCLAAEYESRAVQVSLLDAFDEIDEDVGAAPFSSMDAAQKINAGTISVAAPPAPQRVASPALHGQIG